MTFNGVVGAANPAPQTLGVNNSGVGLYSFSVAVATTSGGSWLSATPLSGAAPLGVNVSANATGLQPGTYQGTITITATTGALNSPATVPVTFVVSKAPAISLSPATLSFSAAQGGASPAPQAVQVSNSGGSVLVYTASVTTASGGPWLSVSNVGTFNLSVSVNSSGLAAGAYSGSVIITSSSASNSPQTLPVTLTITGSTGAGVTASPPSLAFYAATGATSPTNPARALAVFGAGTISFTFPRQTATTSGGNWLGICASPCTTGTTSVSGSGSSTLVVTVNSASLAGGTYNGTVTFSAPGISN